MNSESVERVEVVTGSRLHFGLFRDLPPTATQRSFGGIGVMIDQPAWRLMGRSGVSLSDSDRGGPLIEVDDAIERSTAAVFKQRIRNAVKQYQLARNTPTIEFFLHQAAPSHSGFGSGTQLALAVGKLLDIFLVIDRPASEIAVDVDRGRRSAIGTWGFDLGGFIVDHGKTSNEDIGKLGDRIEFPPEWRFVLLNDPASVGISGKAESKAFAASSGIPEDLSRRLFSIATEEIVPSFESADFGPAAESLGRFGDLVGEYFAPLQGGIFSSRTIGQVVNQLRANGVTGVAQSSWGPAVAVLSKSQSEAEQIAGLVQSFNSTITTGICNGLNSGATVKCQ